MGLRNVAVLDGGLLAWKEAGEPVEPVQDGGDWPSGTFTARPVAEAFVSADDVSAALGEETVAVVDGRCAGRLAGTAPEPRPGMRGGHMPGAVNVAVW